MGTLRGTGVAGPDFVGKTLGNWRLLRRLGEGAFGVVYEGQNVGIAARRAAVKVLHAHMALQLEMKQRFLNEANAASSAEHENIVQIFDGGITEDGTCYSVMELLKGHTLAQLLQRGRFDARRALNIGIQVAGALQAAHEIGVIHRDLKPDNIFIVHRATNAEFAKVLDFGVAKLHGDIGEKPRTEVGMLVGTPQYMSPEQWMTLPDIDGRSDIYSLGIILHECIAGRLPFEAATPYMWQQAHIHEAPPDLMALAPGTPRVVAELVARLMAKDRDHRPQTMLDALGEMRPLHAALSTQPPFRVVAGDLEREIEVDPEETQRVHLRTSKRGGAGGWLALGLVAVLALLGAGWAVLHRPSLPPSPPPGSQLPPATGEAGLVRLPPPAPPAERPATAPALPAELVALGPGELLLGWGTQAAADRLDGPAHPVRVGRFAVGKHEVSMADYRAYAAATGLSGELPWDGVDDFEAIRALPVNGVSQSEASRYCAWKYPTLGGRLPTEEEWEHAARDGKPERRYPWPGERFDPARANAVPGTGPRARLAQLARVDEMPQGATEAGLLHLVGNVAEWTSSPASLYPGQAAGAQAASVTGVVVRGGAANSASVDELSATARRFVPAATRHPFIGFRCAVSLR